MQLVLFSCLACVVFPVLVCALTAAHVVNEMRFPKCGQAVRRAKSVEAQFLKRSAPPPLN